MLSNDSHTQQNSLTTSDLLPLERTKLANERTILAYLRTALTNFAAAASLIQFFFESKAFRITGYILIPIGFIILGFGLYSLYQAKKQMKEIIKE
ncbi:DUF202 domain-containing protein [Mesobacillus maritimus]|uniref:DUF202 domain-containing protein n=1 Tax=Mesobacillus maritimus TaxID=1643336 RepID=UPI00384E1D75